jgi:hypothetical protein
MPPDRPTGVHLDGTLDVECACTANIVPVPAADVRNGITRQCCEGCYIGGPLMRNKGRGQTIRSANGR